ncbi:MAG: hypothetical protein IJC99_04015 [Clostridia bacterium]|nr:hypothetical protein [Clostridia bacterium]
MCDKHTGRGESDFTNGHAICLDCAYMIAVEGLPLLTDSRSTREMLHARGFWHDAD